MWVKAIAIELIRQTPLEDVKYFDILTIDDKWKQKLNEEQRDLNFNCIQQTERCNSCSAISTATNETPKYTAPSYPNITKYDNRTLEAPSRYKRNNTSLIRHGVNYASQRSQIYHRNTEKTQVRIRSRSCNSIAKNDTNNTKPQITVTFDQTKNHANNDEKAFELLLKKCQNHENYVPVKEKLLLFETLCKLGRQVSRSTEDVHLKVEIATKRAKSLHDLHSVSCAGVKQICRYFENKCESKNNDKRLIHSDSHLNTIQRFKSYGMGIQGA